MMLAPVLFLASLQVGSPFGNGMVLQRERPVPVWGVAEAGSKVEVRFASQVKETVVGADGRWEVSLDPMPASKEGRTLVVNDRVFSDVLVGEVWLASGQSNMNLPLWGGNPRYRDGAGRMIASMTSEPTVRLMTVNNGQWSEHPRAFAPKQLVWRKMERGFSDFSAVGYYFARELVRAIDVPVGIVACHWGGTGIDTWIPRDGFATRPELAPIAAMPFTTDKSALPNDGIHTRLEQQPSSVWNAQMAAIAPMACRGLLWYQGEHNAWNYGLYPSQLHALYAGWSGAFRNPEMSFYLVQIVPWSQGWRTPFFQEAQQAYVKENPHAAIAVISDEGNIDDVHPNRKEVVARRLLLHALKRDYGFSEIEDESPVPTAFRVEGDLFIVTLDHAGGLYVYNDDGKFHVPFELAGADGVYRPAEIVNFRKDGNGHISGGCLAEDARIVLRAEGVPDPVSCRFLHGKDRRSNVFNRANLPLGPFHADLPGYTTVDGVLRTVMKK